MWRGSYLSLEETGGRSTITLESETRAELLECGACIGGKLGEISGAPILWLIVGPPPILPRTMER